jgi:hypothetical protein
MKKKLLFITTLLLVSLLALAEMTVYVYQKDGTKDEYLVANVDSIGFVNVFTITFDANGGDGSMEVIKVKEGETITLPANTLTKGSSTFAGWNTQADGTGTAYADKASVSIVASQTLYAQWDAPKNTGIANGHEWVDLGLPSGTKWATCNLGASSPEETGYYIAWGETSPKAVYNLSTYKWYDDTFKTITNEYSFEDILEESDDAASVRWGISWRMPTTAEIYELRNTSYTTWTWTTQNGVQGYKVTSKTNGNSIFLPAAGLRDGSDLGSAGSVGCYWSNKVANNTIAYAYYLRFNYYKVDSEWSNRYYGFSVRPVMRVVTYEVILDSNGGEGTMQPITINYNEKFTVPSNKYTRSGYSFFCWNDKADGSGRNYEVGEKFSLDSDIILYAQWY